MRRFFQRVRGWFSDRPFTSAVIVLLIIVTPGFVRLEQVTNKANDASNRVSLSEERALANEIEEDLTSCQTRNTFQKNTREKFAAFINVVEVAFVSQADNPQRADAIRLFTAQLRDSVYTAPEDEDRDCNGDEKFDDADYLP